MNSELKPWVHYVPVESTATPEELGDLVNWARDHDQKSALIAKTGFEFIKNHLTLDAVECYWRELLTRYQKLIKYKAGFDKLYLNFSN